MGGFLFPTIYFGNKGEKKEKIWGETLGGAGGKENFGETPLSREKGVFFQGGGEKTGIFKKRTPGGGGGGGFFKPWESFFLGAVAHLISLRKPH